MKNATKNATTTTTTTTITPGAFGGGGGDGVFTLGLGFWLMGLLNNSSYVIMIASAKDISEGGTALVFLAMIVPAFLIQLTAPYWFDSVPYERRMIFATACMVTSFGLVAFLLDSDGDDGGGRTTTAAWALLGVAIGSAQCGLGEPTLLAAAGKCDTSGNGRYVSLVASGTGLAGVFGFLWKFVWNDWFRLSMPTTLRLAQLLAVLYIGIFWKYLRPHLLGGGEQQLQYSLVDNKEEQEQAVVEMTTTRNHDQHHRISPTPNNNEAELSPPPEASRDETTSTSTCQPFMIPPVQEMTQLERARFVLTLWRYIIPLFVVYAAEYSLQAGTWTAIGFPVSDKDARDQFYQYSNWMYQAGVFVSRSSGYYFGTTPMWILWLMPILQTLNVRLFVLVASRHFWYSYFVLLPICFYVGLLGGAVYVQGYMRICSDFHRLDRREFALASTSVAASLGIMCADVLGLFIQSCLYRINHIDGAVVSCPR